MNISKDFKVNGFPSIFYGEIIGLSQNTFRVEFEDGDLVEFDTGDLPFYLSPRVGQWIFYPIDDSGNGYIGRVSGVKIVGAFNRYSYSINWFLDEFQELETVFKWHYRGKRKLPQILFYIILDSDPHSAKRNEAAAATHNISLGSKESRDFPVRLLKHLRQFTQVSNNNSLKTIFMIFVKINL